MPKGMTESAIPFFCEGVLMSKKVWITILFLLLALAVAASVVIARAIAQGAQTLILDEYFFMRSCLISARLMTARSYALV